MLRVRVWVVSVAVLGLLLSVGIAATPQASAQVLDAFPDYNGDGYADLAIGTVGSPDSGSIHVLYGGAGGLSAVGTQFWSQEADGIGGWKLASGDFNGDGFDDLAIGVPREDVIDRFGNVEPQAGVVDVLYGSKLGLSETRSQQWSQDTDTGGDGGRINNKAENYDAFGAALGAGDFNGDGFDDLAVGSPYESLHGVLYAGAVNVIYGSDTGLTAVGDQFWTQDSDGVEGTAERRDSFGSALVVGDFNGDGFGDLAIGIDLEDVDDAQSAGAVNVIYGSAAGLSSVGNQLWTQDSAGIKGVAIPGEQFGYVVASGDFDGDGYADLAVGAIDDDVSGSSSGAVNVIYGSAIGLTSAGNQIWSLVSDGIEGAPTGHDDFGEDLASADFSGDGIDDLAIGASGADVPDAFGNVEVRAGVIYVLYGTSAGLTSTGSQLWSQDTDTGGENGRINNRAEPHDHFGASVAVGDYDGNGLTDVAVGVPSEDVHGFESAGAVNVIYGSGTGLTSAGDQFWTEDTDGTADSAGRLDRFGQLSGHDRTPGGGNG